MSTIELEVKDSNLETVLTILNSLKDGFIEKLNIKKSIEEVSDEEQFYYESLLKNRSKEDMDIDESYTTIVKI